MQKRKKSHKHRRRVKKRVVSAPAIQRLQTLASQIGEIIPATAYGKNAFCFQTIAKKLRLSDYWQAGTKREVIFEFLRSVYQFHPRTFYRIFRENIARGIERRHRMGKPVLEEEILQLDGTLRVLDVNLTKEFKALHLPKERPKIIPPPKTFQRMIDELGLHPILQPECGELFKSGHLNESVRKGLEKLEVYVQKKSGSADMGKRLMATAFSEAAPVLKVADTSTQRGKGLQEGFKYLAMGAMAFWRNFCSHGDEKQVGHHHAIAMITTVSHLLHLMDEYQG